jgi:transcriptional regulator with XRE-family HTH domain
MGTRVLNLRGATLNERIDEACEARWRKGLATPSGANLRRIAEVTGVTPEQLLGIYDGFEPPFAAWLEFKRLPAFQALGEKQRRFLAVLPWPPGVEPTVAGYLMAAQAFQMAETR